MTAPRDIPQEYNPAAHALALAAENAALRAQVAGLAGALSECLDYFEDRYDTDDGDDGTPRPNKAMAMGTMVQLALACVSA